MEENSQHQQLKYSLIALLFKTAQVDNDEHVNELAFIKDVANKFSISNQQLIEIKHAKNLVLTLPKSENDRIYFFFHCLQLVELDKKITTSEIDFIKKIGFKLGVNPLLTNDLIMLYVNHMGKSISPANVEGIIKKYLN
jgi:uncharacterized tellurite resistance protein B-like protein